MNFKKLFGAGLVAGAVAISSIGSAGAAVTFDPATGTGFVGKGDVQVPFGWNDAKLQQNAAGVSFDYSSTSDDEYAVTCEWDTGNRKIVHHIQKKRATVGSTVAYDVTKVDRKNPNGKVTGFNLTGITKDSLEESSDGSVPVVGQACPNTGNDAGTDSSVTKLITDVERLSSTSTEALTAYHNASGLSAIIWPPPAPTVA
ncbi:MAG TPA: hypothetical protein VGV93_03205 [Acidimicrobiales bacterium]|nr:hypothetical protein [Acidimicrobiales bacterium]